jgi:hypothetical protein
VHAAHVQEEAARHGIAVPISRCGDELLDHVRRHPHVGRRLRNGHIQQLLLRDQLLSSLDVAEAAEQALVQRVVHQFAVLPRRWHLFDHRLADHVFKCRDCGEPWSD